MVCIKLFWHNIKLPKLLSNCITQLPSRLPSLSKSVSMVDVHSRLKPSCTSLKYEMVDFTRGLSSHSLIFLYTLIYYLHKTSCARLISICLVS